MEAVLKALVEGMVQQALPGSDVKITNIKWTPKEKKNA